MTWNRNLNACLSAAVLACSGTLAHAVGWTYVDPKTFTEDATGLMWDQCSAHSRTEFCVTGSIEYYDSFKKFSPGEALSLATKSNTDGHYGYSDWCVPNFSTLKNLYTNTQNSFPGYPGMGWLMTSTPAPFGVYQVITNNTGYGNTSEYVRLVRSTAYFGPSAACDVQVSAAIPTISAVGTPTNNLVVSLTNGGRGTGYWLAVTDRIRVPTAAEVRAGLYYDYSEGGGVTGGSAPVPGGSTSTNISVARFIGSPPLEFPMGHVYFVLEDSQGNLSSVVGPMANSSLLLQTINFDSPNDTRVGTDVVLRATATSGKTVDLTSATPAVCSIEAGGIAKALQSGICTVNAKLPNDGAYSAAPKVSRSFTFLPKSDQSISFVAAPALQVGGGSATLSATGGATGNPVTFSTGSATCHLSGSNNSVVRGVAAGNCTVQADQLGNVDYNAANPVTQTITVGKGDQSIGFSAPSLQTGATATLSATGGASGKSVTFSTSSAACSLSGSNNSVVRGLAAGSCTVQADQAGDVNYNAASAVTQTITVSKGSQNISFGTAPVLQVGGATVTLSATGGASSQAVTFSTSSVTCSLSGSNNSTVHALTAGSCVVWADQSGDANYNAASTATQTIMVGKGSQTISFGPAPALQVGGASGTLSATGGATVNPVTFSTSSATCSLSGSNNSTVRALAAGSCVVRADQAGDANYNAASAVTQTITVGKGDQSISLGTSPVLLAGLTATLSATGGASGKPVTFSTSSATCSLSGSNNSVVLGLAVGSCTVQADQVGDANYNAASSATQTITVGKGSQNISFGVAPTLLVGPLTATLSATGGASGQPVTFRSSSSACSLSGSNNSVVKGLAAGNCTVQADQVGDVNYNAASMVTQTITVGKGSQTISFGTAPALQVGGASATLSASGGATDNPVTFSTSSAACSLSGRNNSVVKGVASGSCTVQADQAGNADYNPASPVTQTFTLIPAATGSQSYTATTPVIDATAYSPAVPAGTAQVAISGGTDLGCGFNSAQFVAPMSISGALPKGYQAAAAGFQFSSSYCGYTASIQIEIVYTQALPANAVLYKWGPAKVGAVPSWFAYPGVTVSADRKTLSYSITDGGIGDTNPADGYINDPVLVAVPNLVPLPVPTLRVWALLVLSLGLLLLGLRHSSVSRSGRARFSL